MIFGFIGWIFFSVATGMFAHHRRNRSGIGWFFVAIFFSPLVAFILLAILPCRTEHEKLPTWLWRAPWESDKDKKLVPKKDLLAAMKMTPAQAQAQSDAEWKRRQDHSIGHDVTGVAKAIGILAVLVLISVVVSSFLLSSTSSRPIDYKLDENVEYKQLDEHTKGEVAFLVDEREVWSLQAQRQEHACRVERTSAIYVVAIRRNNVFVEVEVLSGPSAGCRGFVRGSAKTSTVKHKA